jgi:hypothetical protein
MKKNLKIAILIVSVLIAAAAVIFIFMNRSDLKLPDKNELNSQKGITFENMGENFSFSSQKRQILEKKFGNDVLESWSPINFDDFPLDFLNEFLPDIYNFSQKLQNRDFREKSGKSSIKIKYPYAKRATEVFKDISLIFSGFTKNPLVFRISSYNHESLMDSLVKKFGGPKKINYNDKNYFFWQKDNSVMIAEIRQDRFTNPYLFITIYYTENINKFFSSINADQSKNIENIF